MQSGRNIICGILFLGFTLVSIPLAGSDPISLMSMMSKIAPHGPLEYSRYGNYCGLGGGGEPLDQVDACCQRHDACYDQIDKKCHLLHGLLITYKWNLNEAQNITCAECSESQFLPFGIPNPAYVICNCKRLICRCDADLVMGLRDNDQYYTEEHLRNIPIAEPGFRF